MNNLIWHTLDKINIIKGQNPQIISLNEEVNL